MKKDVYEWRRALHIPVLIGLQILFIILFGIFVTYDPSGVDGVEKSETDGSEKYSGYPSK